MHGRLSLGSGMRAFLCRFINLLRRKNSHKGGSLRQKYYLHPGKSAHGYLASVSGRVDFYYRMCDDTSVFILPKYERVLYANDF